MWIYIAIYAASWVFGGFLLGKAWLNDFGQISLGDLILFLFVGWVTPATIIAGLAMLNEDKIIIFTDKGIFRSRK